MLGLIQSACIINLSFIKSKSLIFRNGVKDKKNTHPQNGVGKPKEKDKKDEPNPWFFGGEKGFQKERVMRKAMFEEWDELLVIYGFFLLRQFLQSWT